MSRPEPKRDGKGRFTGSVSGASAPTAPDARTPARAAGVPSPGAAVSPGAAAFERYIAHHPAGGTPERGLRIPGAVDDVTGATLELRAMDDGDFEPSFADDMQGRALVTPVLYYPLRDDGRFVFADTEPQVDPNVSGPVNAATHRAVVGRMLSGRTDMTVDTVTDVGDGEREVAVEPDFDELNHSDVVSQQWPTGRVLYRGDQLFLEAPLPPVSASWCAYGGSSCSCVTDRCVC